MKNHPVSADVDFISSCCTSDNKQIGGPNNF